MAADAGALIIIERKRRVNIMLEEFSFHQTQLSYIKSAMDEIAAFRPYGRTPEQVNAMITDGNTARSDYLTKLSTLGTARGALQAAHDTGHSACVSVYAVMKSIYKPDKASLRAISSLPKKDSTPAQTLTRMEATSKLWAELPNPPGSASAFVAGPITKVAFDGLLTDLRTKHANFFQCDQAFQMKEGALHVADDTNIEFITGALIQGRAQFPLGSAERGVIDAVPTESSTPIPGQAVITEATSSGPGTVHLLFSAPHATSYTLLHKGQTDTGFAVVQEGPLNSYDAVNVPPGQNVYKAFGVNSRGTGSEATVTVAVAAEAAA